MKQPQKYPISFHFSRKLLDSFTKQTHHLLLTKHLLTPCSALNPANRERDMQGAGPHEDDNQAGTLTWQAVRGPHNELLIYQARQEIRQPTGLPLPVIQVAFLPLSACQQAIPIHQLLKQVCNSCLQTTRSGHTSLLSTSPSLQCRRKSSQVPIKVFPFPIYLIILSAALLFLPSIIYL